MGMKESYKEELANHLGRELYADGGNVIGVATTKVYAGAFPQVGMRLDSGHPV